MPAWAEARVQQLPDSMTARQQQLVAVLSANGRRQRRPPSLINVVVGWRHCSQSCCRRCCRRESSRSAFCLSIGLHFRVLEFVAWIPSDHRRRHAPCDVAAGFGRRRVASSLQSPQPLVAVAVTDTGCCRGRGQRSEQCSAAENQCRFRPAAVSRRLAPGPP
jgi:hypothetical protein